MDSNGPDGVDLLEIIPQKYVEGSNGWLTAPTTAEGQVPILSPWIHEIRWRFILETFDAPLVWSHRAPVEQMRVGLSRKAGGFLMPPLSLSREMKVLLTLSCPWLLSGVSKTRRQRR